MYSKGRRELLHRRRTRRLWDARPENQRNIHGKQFIDCFYDYHRNLSPESEVWRYEDYLYQGGERLMKDLFADGYVDHAIFQPAHLDEFYNNGFGQTEEAFALAAGQPRKLTYNHYFDPRNGEQGLDAAAGRRRAVRPQGRQALHRRVARGVPRLEARRPVGVPLLRGLPRARHHEHPRAQGPDDPAAGPRRLRRRRHRPRRVGLHRPELHRRARRPAAAGGLLLDRDAGAQRARRSGGRDAVHPHRPALLRADHRRALYWIGEDRIQFSVRLRDLDAALAGRAVRGLPDPRGHDGVRPRSTTARRRRSSGSTRRRCTTSTYPRSCGCRTPTSRRPARGSRSGPTWASV